MRENERALIVIPTYNEAENVESLVLAILALQAGFEILVVDDNSPDGTGDIVEKLGRELAGVHVLHRERKMGLGTAYVTGFRWALEHGYEYVLEMDCDFSHHPRYLETFLDQIEHADLVIGSRYVPGGGTLHWGALRKLVSSGGNLYARSILRLKTHDCTGGFRCYRRSMIELVPWDRISAQGYGFQIGAVYYVERAGGNIVEFPILFEDRRAGQSKMSLAIFIEALGFVTKLAFRERRVQHVIPRVQVEDDQ